MKINRHQTPQAKRTLFTCSLSITLLTTTAMLDAKPTWAANPPDVIMSPGITAVTCAAQKRDHLGNPVAASAAYVFGMFDLRNPLPPDYTTLGPSSTMWNAPDWHHSTWTAQDMGCVFGIATDSAGNTYTAANGLWSPTYTPSFFGDPFLRYGDLGRAGSDELGASGTIYKIDRLTGVASVFARVPQVTDPNLPIDPVISTQAKGGPGIGNITVDYPSGNLFATSLDDGKIYQFDSTGTLLGTFDPFVVETSPVPGMAPLGERLFAIEAHGGKIYFSVWKGGTVTNPNEIWSVSLTGGLIDPPSLTLDFVVPPSYGANSSNSVTVSDLSFSGDGLTMLMGERAFQKRAYLPAYVNLPDFYSPHNHTTSGRKAEFISGSWILTGDVATGNNVLSGEAYGGIEFGFEGGLPEQVIWMSSADIATGAGPHGLQGMRDSDFPTPAGPPSKVPQSYAVPYDPAFTAQGPDFKGMGGDVETMKAFDDCARITIKEILCPREHGGNYLLTLEVTNFQPKVMTSFGAVPTPSSALPPGAIGIQPLPVGWQALTPPLNQGDSTTITMQLPNLSGGEIVCFNLAFLDRNFETCCTETVCLEVPTCECAIAHEVKVDCRQLPDGSWVYDLSIVLENTSAATPSPISAYGISFGPNVTAFDPNFIDLSTNPFNPGDIRTFTTTFTGPAGTLCFKIALHTEGNVECCFTDEICVELPPCGDSDPPKDCCVLSPEKTLCCPFTDQALIGKYGARINFTICNKSDKSKTYHWTLTNLGLSSLVFAQIDPATGEVIVFSDGILSLPPGGCRTVEMIIICDLKPGECADYLFTASAGPGTPDLLCRGQICAPREGSVFVKGLDTEIQALRIDEFRPTTFVVTNPTNTARQVPVLITSSYGAIGISLSAHRPGKSAFEATIAVPAGGETEFQVFLTRLDGGAIVPADFIRLNASINDGDRSGLIDHISAVTFDHSTTPPFRIVSLDCLDIEGSELVKIELELDFDSLTMALEEFDLATKSWHRIPIRTDENPNIDQAELVLAAGRRIIYSPRMNQERGIFRVVCLETTQK